MSAIKLLEEVYIGELLLDAAVVARRNNAMHLAASLDNLHARIDALIKTGGWIPVSEGLPDIDLPVWVWNGTDIWVGCRAEESDGWLWAKSYSHPEYYAGEWTCADAETDDDYQPTHWMPLPIPPLPEAK